MNTDPFIFSFSVCLIRCKLTLLLNGIPRSWLRSHVTFCSLYFYHGLPSAIRRWSPAVHSRMTSSLSLCVCVLVLRYRSGITPYSFADLNQRMLQCYVREPFQFYCSTHPLLNWQPLLQSSHTWPLLERDLAWFQEKNLMFNQQAGPFCWLRLLIRWVFDWWGRVDDTFGSWACSSHPRRYRACIFFVLSKTRDNFPGMRTRALDVPYLLGWRGVPRGRSYQPW